MKKKKYVYLEFSINRITLGKVYFELFNDEEIKKSVDNFLSLCKGQDYHSIYSNDILSYKYCKIERIKKGKCIKSGYLRNKININDDKTYYLNNNNGGDDDGDYNSIDNIYNSLKNKMKNSKKNKYEKVECIYGNYYNKEYSKRKHTCAGLLTIVQVEDKKYSSIFKITLNKTHTYNNKNIIIGQVIKNMHILRAIEMLPTCNNGNPKVLLYISDCNEVNEAFFKKEKISSRQMYINNMFKMAAQQSVQNGLSKDNNNNNNNNDNIINNDDDNIINNNDLLYEQQTYNHSYDNYTIGNQSHDKFKNEHINEKQRGIILLNKIFQQIDDHVKNKHKIVDYDNKNKITDHENNLKEKNEKHNTLHEGNVKNDYFHTKQTNRQKYNYFKENDEKDNQNEKQLSCRMSEKYHLTSSFDNHEKNLKKHMTERERKLLEIQMKINQSKICNHMEVKKEKMYEDRPGLINTHRFDEYTKYKYDKNVSITDVHSKGKKNKETQEGIGSLRGEQKEDIINTANGSTNNNTYVNDDDDHNNNNNNRRDKLYNTSAFHVKKIMHKKNKKKDDTYELENDTNLYKKIKFNFSINRKIYDEKKKIHGSNFYNINLLNHENTKANEYDKNKVVEFCKKQEELRSKMSRKRKEKEGIFKNYINQRNKIYNKKLDRYFNKHTLEIRNKLENPS
ncbi:isomerase [Plasmodium falciparum IGH-CR14]|uniref:Isomerase n=5 Tax=Plasmodium falciparum TaxID=5833 RepID=A0A0L1IA48_PLAFA|nr:hypothetical protein PFNF135_02078 [Plasmodium falciparum NF135/5.C10]ETW50009.1 hypothetical protein PFMALIP_01977 [Plasmodium falciparum MaliPS096_E11]KNG76008.1 isomerase [Plasmodium falciparum IGH-CR14]KOB60533.1 hypothetical protein PFHG_02320 [Plasmodium falciparum HB3]